MFTETNFFSIHLKITFVELRCCSKDLSSVLNIVFVNNFLMEIPQTSVKNICI